MNAIPFHFPEVYGGLADSEGLLSVSADALILEFQIKDSLIGAIKSSVKRVELPYDKLDEIRLRANFIRVDLTIVANSLQLVEDIPNAKNGQIQVKFPRSHRREAAALAREASIRVSQNKLDNLERVLESEKTHEDDT